LHPDHRAEARFVCRCISRTRPHVSMRARARARLRFTRSIFQSTPSKNNLRLSLTNFGADRSIGGNFPPRDGVIYFTLSIRIGRRRLRPLALRSISGQRERERERERERGGRTVIKVMMCSQHEFLRARVSGDPRFRDVPWKTGVRSRFPFCARSRSSFLARLMWRIPGWKARRARAFDKTFVARPFSIYSSICLPTLCVRLFIDYLSVSSLDSRKRSKFG